MKTKFCPGCVISKSIDEFYNNVSKPDGKDSYCKICRNVFNKKRSGTKPGWKPKPKRLVPKDHKYCPSCERIKLETDFYRNKARHDGFHQYCKVCSSIKKRNSN